MDNESAAASIIRGAPNAPDVAAMVRNIHLLAHCLGVRFWVEWVDSDSNPADGLSRDGLEDIWTKAQGWNLERGVSPPRVSLKEAFLLWG